MEEIKCSDCLQRMVGLDIYKPTKLLMCDRCCDYLTIGSKIFNNKYRNLIRTSDVIRWMLNFYKARLFEIEIGQSYLIEDMEADRTVYRFWLHVSEFPEIDEKVLLYEGENRDIDKYIKNKLDIAIKEYLTETEEYNRILEINVCEISINDTNNVPSTDELYNNELWRSNPLPIYTIIGGTYHRKSIFTNAQEVLQTSINNGNNIVEAVIEYRRPESW